MFAYERTEPMAAPVAAACEALNKLAVADSRAATDWPDVPDEDLYLLHRAISTALDSIRRVERFREAE